MLIKVESLKGYKLHSLDGEIGEVKEFYFDDRHWTVRYLIAETGNWLMDRQVLISPHAIRDVNREKRYISINLTKNQIVDSPSLENDKPVSRQFEDAYYVYYGYPMYWNASFIWGANPFIIRDRKAQTDSTPSERTWDPNLRSTADVRGHAIQTKDGEIGHVEDFIIDEETWTIRYLVINTRLGWPVKKALISPEWIDDISDSESKIFANLLREDIRLSPEYTQETLLNRDFETSLHQYYNRQGYWVDEKAAKEQSS